MAKISRPLSAIVCTLAIAGAAHAQTFSVLHTFQFFPHGADPGAPLIRDASGNLYGTTNGGGSHNAGVAFKLDSAGRQTVLHTFSGGADGGCPCGGLVSDAAGNLYGTAHQGGIAGAGVVYQIDASGRHKVLYSFTGGADGAGPYAGLILDTARNLYGTTYSGGAAGSGVVYKLSPSGQQTVLYSFTGGADGANPQAGLTVDGAGYLYGTTYLGGLYKLGVIFKLSPAGQETVLHSFTGDARGFEPSTGVVLDPAGNIYGTAIGVVYKLDPSGTYTILRSSGKHGDGFFGALARDTAGNIYGAESGGYDSDLPYGAVYKLDSSGGLSWLFQFNGSSAWLGPTVFGTISGLILDPAGNLYGTSISGGIAGIVYEIETSGTVKIRYNFQSAPSGTGPQSGVTLDAAGNLYGTAASGGAYNAGVVYKMSAAGNETVLYAFKGTLDSPGGAYQSNVVLDQAGNLYGTTATGGSGGQGTVYKLTPSGQQTILHSFTGGVDGGWPSGVALDAAGNLYGTAQLGGSGSLNGVPDGTVFKLDANGKFTVLYSFTGLADGGEPRGGLAVDAAGNLYGNTYLGGAENGGVIFKIDTIGAYSVLHAFASSSDGASPQSGVTLDSSGNIYGACPAYGPRGAGTVYKLDTAGNFSVLYAFSGGRYERPASSVVRDAAGNLYGTLAANQSCPGGMAGSCGIVYRIDPSGDETVLHSFTGGSDGANPVGVALDSAGHLYGVATGLLPNTVAGGGGVVFQVTLPPTGPPPTGPPPTEP